MQGQPAHAEGDAGGGRGGRDCPGTRRARPQVVEQEQRRQSAAMHQETAQRDQPARMLVDFSLFAQRSAAFYPTAFYHLPAAGSSGRCHLCPILAMRDAEASFRVSLAHALLFTLLACRPCRCAA